MSVITISRGSYSHGKEIAEKVAQKLGYECISREIIFEASEEFNVPEIKLTRAIHDAPSILDSFTHGKDQYISYIKVALLQHLRKDNVVYHGLAGHFFVKDITHVLKVRILADINERVKLEMEKEGLAEKKALQLLTKDDEERRKWSHHLYGIDTSDAGLYDLDLHIHKITVDDAVDFICHTVGLKQFQTTPETQKAMDDLALAAEVEAVLIRVGFEICVSAENGMIHVKTWAPALQEPLIVQEIETLTKKIPSVKDVETEFRPITLFCE
jgi:cytidylate kinase